MRIPSSPTLKQVCRCFWCNYAKLRRKRHSFTCWCVNICDCTANTRDKDRDSDWNTLIRTLSPTSMSGVISQVPSWTSFRYASAELDPLHLHYILYPCAPHTFCNWGRQLRLQLDKTIVHLIITIGWDGSGSLAYVGFELIDCWLDVLVMSHLAHQPAPFWYDVPPQDAPRSIHNKANKLAHVCYDPEQSSRLVTNWPSHQEQRPGSSCCFSYFP